MRKKPSIAWDELDAPALRLVTSTGRSAHAARRILAVFVVATIALGFLPFQQSASGTGRVAAFAPEERRQAVESPLPGRVVELHVDEGARVREGDPLVTLADNDPLLLDRFAAERQALETRLVAYRSRADLLRERVDSVRASQDATLATARARVTVAEERLRSTEEARLAADASLQAAELQMARQARLVEEGLVSERDVELTQLALARARTDRAAAEAAVGAARGEQSAARAALAQADADSAARIQEAEAGYESAESDFAGAEGAIQRLDTTIARAQQQVVRAPRPGVVYRVHVRVGGEQVSAGDPLVTLVPDDSTRAVELWVDGNDAPLVVPGRRVRLQFEGWPAIQFTGWPQVAVGTFGGVVAFVDAADDGGGDFRVLVVADPDQPSWPGRRFLRQGVRANGWILLDQVRFGYEIWRRFNGFPPSLRRRADAGGPSSDDGRTPTSRRSASSESGGATREPR